MAKYLCADAGFEAADRAVQTHGGMGYAERVPRRALLPRGAADRGSPRSARRWCSTTSASTSSACRGPTDGSLRRTHRGGHRRRRRDRRRGRAPAREPRARGHRDRPRRRCGARRGRGDRRRRRRRRRLQPRPTCAPRSKGSGRSTSSSTTPATAARRCSPRWTRSSSGRVLDVHLMGTFNVAQEALSHLPDDGTGRIINSTSAAGLVGHDRPGQLRRGQGRRSSGSPSRWRRSWRAARSPPTWSRRWPPRR